MFAGISSSLSGLATAQTKINTAANNIANANSIEFKKSRTLSEESSSGGVQVSLEKVNTPGVIVFQESDQGLIEQELSNGQSRRRIGQSSYWQKVFRSKSWCYRPSK